MITIEQIQATGVVPESFHNIAPGCAIFYAPKDGVSSSTKKLVLDLFDKCKTQREGFALKIDVETTSNQFLQNTIVAKRLNLGSLYRYNLLIGCVNCKESVDAFIKEFFNLASRDDEALKLMNKKQPEPRYDFFDEPSFAPTGMIQMIVMKPTDEEENDFEDVMERTSEQIEDDNKLIQQILDYAYKDHEEVALELLERLSPRIYTHGECKLLLTEGYRFWIKAGNTVELDLTKRETALYLFLLAHSEGIEKKRISEYKEEIEDYYFNQFKKLNDKREDKAIENLVAFKDTRNGYKLKALDECTNRINSALNQCIMNRTSQMPFKIQNTDGVLHVDLPRKFLEWDKKNVIFKIIE